MEAERLRKQAIAKGETLPSEEKFDSNCITPGTQAWPGNIVKVIFWNNVI